MVREDRNRELRRQQAVARLESYLDGLKQRRQEMQREMLRSLRESEEGGLEADKMDETFERKHKRDALGRFARKEQARIERERQQEREREQESEGTEGDGPVQGTASPPALRHLMPIVRGQVPSVKEEKLEVQKKAADTSRLRMELGEAVALATARLQVARRYANKAPGRLARRWLEYLEDRATRLAQAVANGHATAHHRDELRRLAGQADGLVQALRAKLRKG